MTLRCQYCNDSSSDEKESMLFIILEDKAGIEKMRVPLYLSDDAVKSLPDLEASFKEVPKLLQMIYTSGLNQENIQFITENIEL